MGELYSVSKVPSQPQSQATKGSSPPPLLSLPQVRVTSPAQLKGRGGSDSREAVTQAAGGSLHSNTHRAGIPGAYRMVTLEQNEP